MDIQPEMLDGVKKRAEKAGLSNRINLYLSGPSGTLPEGMFDAALAFWMMHEVSGQKGMLTQLKLHLNPGGLFLLVEPKMHVNKTAFDRTVSLANDSGFTSVQEVRILFSRGVLLCGGDSRL